MELLFKHSRIETSVYFTGYVYVLEKLDNIAYLYKVSVRVSERVQGENVYCIS